MLEQPADNDQAEESPELVRCDNCGRHGWHETGRCPETPCASGRPMTEIPDGGIAEYLADRYDRLRNCAEILASETDFGDGFLTVEIVRAFADELATERVLDGLTEHYSDTVGMLVLLDLLKGPRRMAWRLTDWLSDNRSVDREDDDEVAVVSVLARVLAMYCAAFAGNDFERAQGIAARDGADG